MGAIRRWVALILGLGVAFSAPAVIAEVKGTLASVVHAGRVAPRMAGEGDARVVPVARGEAAYLGEFTLAAGAELTPPARKEEEYLYILRGSAILAVDQQTFLVGPRMGIYIPAGASVRWTNGPSVLMAVQVFAGPELSADFGGERIRDDKQRWPRERRKKKRTRGRTRLSESFERR